MEQLGIQPALLIAQLVNFAIIVVVLNKLLYKPIVSFLAKRKAEIAEGLELTEKMREETEKTEQKRTKALDLARKDAHAMVETAKKQAKDEARLIVEKAHKDASVILQKAKIDAEQAGVEVQKELKNQSVDLAIAMVERIIPEILSTDAQKKLVQKQLKALASTN